MLKVDLVVLGDATNVVNEGRFFPTLYTLGKDLTKCL